jgi:glyceraldehyde-3-phosphate dehydrogenase/erythrose-4-phosphate dehydrogenase
MQTTDLQEDIIILGFGRVGQAVLQSLLAYCSAQVIQILFFLTHLFFFSYQVQCILYMVEAERYRSSVLF